MKPYLFALSLVCIVSTVVLQIVNGEVPTELWALTTTIAGGTVGATIPNRKEV